ncbi:MAG TPA: PAS domain S-box protein [Longimicrobiaceae bacterium]|nr:PAS domain S-box protein [Longimicrobiaceae bacterium]
MQSDDIVRRQIRSAQRRMEALARSTREAPPEAHAFVDSALHELQTAMEELRVTEEELRQQNEALAASREALETERERYRDLFHSAPDAYLVTDCAGVIREANRAAAALLGVAETRLAGKPLALFVDAEHRRDFRARLAQHPAGGGVQEWEFRIRSRGSEAVDASCTVGLIRDRAGGVEGLRWLLRDVTERRRLETERAARAAAETGRERVEAILESIADGFLALDADWRFAYVNRAAEFLLQRDRAELLGKTFTEAFPDDVRRVGAELERARREHDVAEFEEFHPSLGSWLEYRAFPADGGLTLYVRDVTDRRVAQEELRTSEERQRVALRAARMAHWDWDLRSGVVHWSPEHNRMMGLPAGQSRGSYEAFMERVHPDDREALAETLRPALEAGEDFATEFRVVHPDGRRRWIAGYGRPLPGEDGRPARMVGVVRDVTERKEAEERDRFLGRVSDVLASSLDYRSTLQTLATLCAGSLADYCLVQVEEKGELRAPGVAHADPARAEILRGMMRRFPVDPAGPHPAVRAIRTGEPQLLAEVPPSLLAEVAGSPEHLEMLQDLGLTSAIVVPLQARGRTLGAISLARTGGAPYGAGELAVAEEVARRAALAVDNARLYEEARQAARARDEVLAVVSHDLRNPLHAVLLAATILEDLTQPGQWTERDLKQLHVIRRSAEQMTGLIQDLVEVIALEQGAPALHLARLDAAALPASVGELFHAQAEERGIHLVVETAPGLPPVEADRGRVLQVFSNLVGNALKFTPSGGTVTVRAEAAEGRVRFSVSDTGPGIPPEHLPRLFDRFWQADRSRAGGLGLGLAIARGIVEAHGGKIEVESAPGEGTTFSFTLPALPF